MTLYKKIYARVTPLMRSKTLGDMVLMLGANGVHAILGLLTTIVMLRVLGTEEFVPKSQK